MWAPDKNPFDGDGGYSDDDFSDTPSSSHAADMVDLEDFQVKDLLALRARIDKLLPAANLSHMDLINEAVVNYIALKTLQDEVLGDKSVAPNQKAQVANACVSALTQLDKVQREAYTFERYKAIENALTRTLQQVQETAGDEAVRSILAQYRQEYEAMGKPGSVKR